MRILFVHNYYQYSGGEDAVLNNERALLAEYGHDVRLFTVSNDAVQSLWDKVKTAWQTSYSYDSQQRFTRELIDVKPDIVHVHNFFPLLTPSIYGACQNVGVPVVQTLHNYRTICPGALLMRDNGVCEDCVTGSAYQSVLHGCYRGSILGTLAVAWMVETHRKQGTWQEEVDRFIALTQFAKSKFVQAGFPEDKISVKPNFISEGHVYPNVFSQGERKVPTNRCNALFIGRLSSEKGIKTLFQAWRSLDVPLLVIGDGPLLDMAQNVRLPTVTILGRKTPEEVMIAMRQAAFLVMPSEWYEGFPMVLLEAFANRLPVIISRLGGMAEIVEDNVTGLHFEPGNAEDFAAKVRWAANHPNEMRRLGENAWRMYEAKYTPQANYFQLVSIYEEAIQASQKRRLA